MMTIAGGGRSGSAVETANNGGFYHLRLSSYGEAAGRSEMLEKDVKNRYATAS